MSTVRKNIKALNKGNNKKSAIIQAYITDFLSYWFYLLGISNNESIETEKSLAIFGIRVMSGYERPCSHFETA